MKRVGTGRNGLQSKKFRNHGSELQQIKTHIHFIGWLSRYVVGVFNGYERAEVRDVEWGWETGFGAHL